MNPEGIMLSEISQRQILYNITCMWNLKNTTDVNIAKEETDSQKQRKDQWLPVGTGKVKSARQKQRIKRQKLGLFWWSNG